MSADQLNLTTHRACVLFATAIRRLINQRQVVFHESRTHSRPAAAPVGVGLIENGDALATNVDEVVDKTLRLLLV